MDHSMANRPAFALPTADKAIDQGVTRPWLPAALVTLGTLSSLFGISWDVQWHIDVGPDTFFTLPHLVLYAGSAIAGLTSLAVVLMTTARQRAGRLIDPLVGGRHVRVLGGAFAAPVGYLVSGTGAAMFLLTGLWDMWWHTLYGFDATLSSPPHVSLFLSITVTMAGSVIVYGAAREQRWGRIGMIIAMPVMVAFSMITLAPVKDLPGVVNPQTIGSAFLSLMLLITAAACLRRPGGALAIGLVLAAMQGVLWVYSPWAAHVYAGFVGLPLRDYVEPVPAFPSKLPMFLVLAAASVELVLWRARSRRWPMRWAPLAAGALGGAVVAVCAPLQDLVMTGHGGFDMPPLVATTIGSAAFGVLAGFLGWRFGTMMRGTTATPNTAASTTRPLIEGI
ncbi:hypothetical protein [Sphaerisporangium album]|uniref:hypothetical protein n=1 Tax=Sphaerisporangium album TaxID=509200 RepID=UPI0015F0E987|nr:hypothetical protein [Sphaerisporangium album]